MHAGDVIWPRVRGRASGKGSSIGWMALIGLAGGCWVVSAVRMDGMDAGPTGYLGATGWFMATWIVMMAAMMLPAIAPVALAPAAWDSKRALVGRVARSATFVGMYLVVWAAGGLFAYELVSAARGVAGDTFAWNLAGRWAVLAVLAAAAVYQLTGRKQRALARCRRVSHSGSPALSGLTTGLNCLRSSWLMTAALFALGAMSLWWMVVVALLIAAERLPRRAAPGRLAGAAIFLALALGVAVSPAAVPGLTLPGSAAANKAMMRMSRTPGMDRGAPGTSNKKSTMR